MNEQSEKVINAVCDYFKIEKEALGSGSRKAPIPLAKKLIIHLLPNVNSALLQQELNLSKSSIYNHRTEINLLSEVDMEIKQSIHSIKSSLEEMNVKLNKSQIGSLYEIFESFLTMSPDNPTLELVCILIDEIKEKCRKKLRSGKENLSLDEKQLRGFLIWYQHFGGMWEQRHPYAHMTLLDIINQLKPVNYAKTVPIKT